MTPTPGKSALPTRPVSPRPSYRFLFLIAVVVLVAYQHNAVITQMAEMRAARRVDNAYVRGLEDANRHSATMISDLTKENTRLWLRIAHLEEGNNKPHGKKQSQTERWMVESRASARIATTTPAAMTP